ncbi:hypothetical protein KI387_016599, partial [Taxus chinensis]
ELPLGPENIIVLSESEERVRCKLLANVLEDPADKDKEVRALNFQVLLISLMPCLQCSTHVSLSPAAQTMS